MKFTPTNVSKPNDDTLRIKWSDGLVADMSITSLRDKCPCATCREKRHAAATKLPELLPVLDKKETLPLRIESMKPVGNYAYSILFSDGHDTGIYTLEFLRELSEK